MVRALAFALTLIACSLVSFADAAPAQADVVQIAARVGTTALRSREGAREFHPHLRLDVGLRVAGPLAIGAYLDVTGESFPMRSPHFGAGAQLVLRPTLPGTSLRPMVEVSAGRTRLPSAQQDPVSAWVATGAVGLGLDLSKRVTLEARVSHSWYFGLDESADLTPRSMTGSLGFVLRLP